MSFSIIIPSRKAENLVPCVEAILRNEPELSPEKIIVIDDGAKAGAEDRLPGLTWITGVAPFIFARNVNLGILFAKDDVILLNDDAQLQTMLGFTKMSEASEGWGIVAPRTNVSGNPNQMRQHTDCAVWEEHKRAVPFLCVYIPRATINTVGLLDEQFIGYGGEDSDYCHRTRLEGLKLGISGGCFVDHLSLCPTFRKSSQSPGDTAIADKIMRDKWGANG